MAEEERPSSTERNEVSFVLKAYVKDVYVCQGLERGPFQQALPRVAVAVRFARLVPSFPRAYHVYLIEVDTAWGAWSVQRRYNQFVALNDEVVRARQCAGVAPLPPKVYGLRPSSDVAQARIPALERYLASVAGTPFVHHAPFWAFLGVLPFANHFVPDHPVPLHHATPSRIASEFLFNSDRSAPVCLVEYAAAQLRAVVVPGPGDDYDSRALPSLRELIVSLIHAGHVTFTTFALTLIYARRIRGLRGSHAVRGAPHLLLMALLIITTKYWDDMPQVVVVNRWFDPAEICAMELECLSALVFSLNVDPADYETFVRRLDVTVRREFSGHSGAQALKAFEARQARSWPRPIERQDSERISTWVFYGKNSPDASPALTSSPPPPPPAEAQESS